MINPEKYFDKTNLVFEMGEVCKISIVPSLYSSENRCIVRLGIKIINNNGDSKNNPFIWLNPESSILKSLENNHKNALLVNK